ncbi:hypothetical protein PNEG_01526 [Pneumocystis murina B123]|uniref:BZIP domain-containing protein n=1 Tax=Pneumocystis murina (strain B123) TaxID=1069680 RepID=M7P8W5_PNEMU|nr:hypothetical protein PNEG_01526 [Pneumocystis murina B123]EMR10260.1 hypothetical protein PNEG_01526 [Pneumocystis murina B123]
MVLSGNTTDSMGNLEISSNSNLETNSENSALIVISKDWSLPPRIKPGRKPSEEPPLTKRKAQNREAQRAFRERRAIRVLELETTIKQQRDHMEKLKQEYLGKIQFIVLENEKLKRKNKQLEEQIIYLKSNFEKAKSYLDFNTDVFFPFSKEDHSNTASICDYSNLIIGESVPLKKKNTSRKTKDMELDDVLFHKKVVKESGFTHNVESKDLYNDLGLLVHQKNSETNYRDQINTDSSLSSLFVPKNDSTMEENDCGFCIGNPDLCLCLQSQNLNNEMTNTTEVDKYILPPILIDNNDEKMAEKIQKDVEKTEKLKILEPSSYTIKNEYEPGSCAQCKADSLSMLFCKTFASRINYNRVSFKSYKDEEKYNCNTNTLTNNSLNNNNFLSCSAAYKTLSQHEKFVKENFRIIVDNLAPGSCGMQIQANRVQETLRLLDQ